jgi:hypothetical protein
MMSKASDKIRDKKADKIRDKIKEAENYGREDFLDFIDKNKLLKGYINIREYKNFGPTRKDIFFEIAFKVIRKLRKPKYDEWCSNIEILAKKNPGEMARKRGIVSNNRKIGYFLAFCISDRDKLTQALYAIHCPKKKKVKKVIKKKVIKSKNIWDLVEVE